MFTAQDVMALRQKTGAGMMDCKKALTEAQGDMESAIDILRVRFQIKEEQRASRTTNEGRVGTYIHTGGKLGVLVEVACETDFVAKNVEFAEMVHLLAMHIAAANPLAVSRDEIPQDILDREIAIFKEQLAESGKPESVWEKIVQGKIDKFFSEKVLLEQPYVRDPERTVGDIVTEMSARTGEKVVVKRFSRFAVGEV